MSRVKEPPTTSLVNRDPPSHRSFGGAGSATRRAMRLDVEFDVGELCFASRSVRSRKADPALDFQWRHACCGWRAKFKLSAIMGDPALQHLIPLLLQAVGVG